MKKNFIKAALASITAFMTVSTLTASAFNCIAVDSSVRDDLPAHKLQTSSETAEIVVMKDILAFNPENKRIPEPNMVYSYAITSANVTDATITTIDSNNNPVPLTVYPGVIQAVTAITDSGNAEAQMSTSADGLTKNGTITFKCDPNNLKYTNKETDTPYVCSEDYKFTKQMGITINASKIYDPDNNPATQNNGVGIYRYKITETTAEDTYVQSGVTEGTAGDVVYLDVYVKNKDEGNGLLIYGYVMLKGVEITDSTSITYSETVDEGVKIDGFTTTYEGDTNGDGSVIPGDFKGDKYLTYNADIKKQVSGDFADRQHEFPFLISASNNTVKNANFSVNDGAIHAVTALDANGAWSSESGANLDDINFNLKHGEIISLIGLPAGTKVKVKETNDTDVAYAVSATCDGNAKQVVNSDETKSGNSISIEKDDTAEMVEAYSVALKDNSNKIIITNTLRDISITGLIFDIAPFIFITAAGILLFIIFMKNKKKDDTDNMI